LVSVTELGYDDDGFASLMTRTIGWPAVSPESETV
jgi:hypothetical protein